jgi:hypothetical protein
MNQESLESAAGNFQIFLRIKSPAILNDKQMGLQKYGIHMLFCEGREHYDPSLLFQ